jgi:hypothetical protein
VCSDIDGWCQAPFNTVVLLVQVRAIQACNRERAYCELRPLWPFPSAPHATPPRFHTRPDSGLSSSAPLQDPFSALL